MDNATETKVTSDIVAERKWVESQLSKEEKDVLDLVNVRYEMSLTKRDAKLITVEEEGEILDEILEGISGAKEAFDKRSQLEDEYHQLHQSPKGKIH